MCQEYSHWHRTLHSLCLTLLVHAWYSQIFTPETVRNTLSLMFSCGMYDYSGEFAYSIGLPAKSGVAGCVMVVVPNLFGLCIWSPPLDRQGNSVRGVDFCTRLTSRYAFHVFDTVTGMAMIAIINALRKNVSNSLPIDWLIG
jgi:glutaminase